MSCTCPGGSFDTTLQCVLDRWAVSEGISGSMWLWSASLVCSWPVRICWTTLSQEAPPTIAACRLITACRPITICPSNRYLVSLYIRHAVSCMTMYDHVWPCMVTCSTCSSLDRDVIVFQMEPKTLLRAFIPMDSSGAKLDRCRRLGIFAIPSPYCMIRSTHWHQFLPHWSRYVEPQWQLLAENSSINTSLLRTEECLDGWAFDQSEFFSTTVSEVTKGNLSICFFTCILTPLGSNHHQKFKRPHIWPQSKLCPSPTDGWTCIPKESDSLSLLV